MPARTKASQPAATQSRTQRRRRGRDDDEDEEMATQAPERRRARDEDEDEAMDDEEGGEGERDNEEDSLEKKAAALVRLALFNESKRMPLKRDEISKKVLGSSSRSFNVVFERAQKILRKTFAMELVELMSRAEREREANGGEEGEATQGTGIKKKAASSGVKSYILRSVLDEDLIALAAQTDVDVLTQEMEIQPGSDEEYDENAEYQNYGSILSWTASDQLGALGILYVVLALILVQNRSLGEMTLRSQLRRLRLDPMSTITLSASGQNKVMSTDAYLTQLVKQGYLDVVKIATAGTQAPRATQKRGRASQAARGEDEDGAREWRWGSRAYAEVGELAVGRFVAEFMVERMRAETDAGDADGEEGANGNGGARAREAKDMRMVEEMMKGLARAAGGALSEAR